MDRRQSLKLIATGMVATGAAVAGCQPADQQKAPETKEPSFALDRTEEELEYEKTLLARGSFFTAHEMAAITILADLIIPRDDISGNASDAGVPAFIDFIVRDMPQHQTPLRGGLRWLDAQCTNRFGRVFKDCTQQQQIEMVDLIAYPDRARENKELTQGVAFFSLMRNLTASGFYTSSIGVADLGYAGNKPNQWNGVPEEVLKQYNLAYTEKELQECVRFEA